MNTNAKVEYVAEIIRDGEIVQTAKGHNLLCDGFFSAVMITRLDQLCNRVKAGTSNTSNSRDSGVVTFNTNNGAPLIVTASAGFFVAGDAGNILKLDSGEQLRISTYDSATQVTCITYPGTIVNGSQGTVWMTARTNLVAPVLTVDSSPSIASADFLDIPAATYRCEFTRVYDFAASGSAYSINEFGWFQTSIPSVMIGRVVTSSPLTVLVGDQIRITVKFIYNCDTTSYASGSGAFAGTTRFYGCTPSAAAVYLSPYPSGITSFGFHIGTIDQTTIYNAPRTLDDSHVWSFVNLGEGVYEGTSGGTVSENNGTWTGVSNNGIFVHKFTTPVTKTNLQIATWKFLLTHTRDMPN